MKIHNTLFAILAVIPMISSVNALPLGELLTQEERALNELGSELEEINKNICKEEERTGTTPIISGETYLELTTIKGVYHSILNRLQLYDKATSRALREKKDQRYDAAARYGGNPTSTAIEQEFYDLSEEVEKAKKAQKVILKCMERARLDLYETNHLLKRFESTHVPSADSWKMFEDSRGRQGGLLGESADEVGREIQRGY